MTDAQQWKKTKNGSLLGKGGSKASRPSSSARTRSKQDNPRMRRQSRTELLLLWWNPTVHCRTQYIFLPRVQALLPKRIAALLTTGWNVLARIFGLSHPNFCETCQRSAKCLAYAHQLQDRPQAGQNKY